MRITRLVKQNTEIVCQIKEFIIRSVLTIKIKSNRPITGLYIYIYIYIILYNITNSCISTYLGRPEPVHNCTQVERSHESIMLKCSPGFDGGLAQLFTLELRPWTRSINPLDNKGMMMRSNSVAANVDVDENSELNMVIINI